MRSNQMPRSSFLLATAGHGGHNHSPGRLSPMSVNLIRVTKISGVVRWEPPCFSRGELDFSPSGEASDLKEWALALGCFNASAKAHDQNRTLPGALKRSFPRINAGAPTNLLVQEVSLS
jgi:hypothetical protein